MSSLTLPQEITANTRTSHVALFIISFLSTALGGTVSTLMSVYLPVVAKELLSDRSSSDLAAVSSYINAIFIFGWTIGGFLFGILSDRIGRKPSYLFCIGCFGLGSFLTGIMTSWEGVVICRLVSGFGMGGILVISNTMMTEVWPTKTRAIYIGILSISFPVGIFSAGLINFFFTGWREGFYIGIVPLVLAAAGFWLLKESETWKSGTKAQATTGGLFKQNNLKALIVGSVTFGTMLIGLWAVFSWLPTWVQSLVNDGDGHRERGLSMMLMGIGGLAGGFLSGWIANAIGLTRSMIVCFAVCSILCLVLFKTNISFNPVLVYTEIGLLALFFGISQGVLSVFVPLLFGVDIRASATGFCFNVGRIFTALAVLFVGVLVDMLGGYGNALFIFSLVFVIGLIMLLITNFKHKFGIANGR